jgi:peptidoglycan/LPS O-acetylase OafA/YrhL
MFVFLAHAGLGDIVPGGFGVTVFFFLSGFLITTLMRSEYERNGSINLRHFWLRRGLRILPPFYLVLAAASIFAVLTRPAGTLMLPAVAAQLVHVTNYWIIYRGDGGQAPGTGVYWSLAVEEHFYLLFPWLYIVMRRRMLTGRQQALLLWGLCALILLWRCVLVLALDAPVNRTYFATDTRVDSILFGCALAVWNNPVLQNPLPGERWWRSLGLPLALLILVFCVVYRNPAFRETLRYSLQGLALTAVFVTAVRFWTWWPFKVLNARPVVFVGVLSYSLYLVHLVVLGEMARYLPSLQPVLRGAAAFGVALLLAWVIYVLVETPCARLRRRLTD